MDCCGKRNGRKSRWGGNGEVAVAAAATSGDPSGAYAVPLLEAAEVVADVAVAVHGEG